MPSNRIEYMRKYFTDNRDKILSRMSEKIMCDNCNCLVVRSHMNRHQKTKKCEKNKNVNGLSRSVLL